MIAEDVEFQTPDGFTIRGTCAIPKNPFGAVLLLHGITVDRNEYVGMYRELSDFLGERGLASLRFDFRGHGLSSGDQTDFSIIGQTIDSRSALNWLRDRFSALKFFGGVGCSFGAPPLIFLSQTESSLDRICLFAPVLSYRQTFLVPQTAWAAESFTASALQRAEITGELLLDDSFRLGIRLIEEMKIIDPISVITSLKSRITIVHGKSDSMVPFDISAEVADEFPSVTLFAIPNMDHGYFDINDPSGDSERTQRNKMEVFRIIASSLGV